MIRPAAIATRRKFYKNSLTGMFSFERIAFTFDCCEQSKLTPYAQPRRVFDELTLVTVDAMALAASALCAFIASVVEPMYAVQPPPERGL